MIAIDHRDHRKPPLDMRQILVVVAKHKTGALVIPEGERDL
jgi:hypothetical protein